MEESNLSQLLNVTRNKKELFNEMLVLTKRQAKIIKDKKFQELEVVLNEKDVIIEQIDEINIRYKNLIAEEKIEDKELLSLIMEMDNILNEIKLLENENNKELSESMAEMKKDLKDGRQGMKAMKNYNNSDPYQAFASQGGTLFIDQDS